MVYNMNISVYNIGLYSAKFYNIPFNMRVYYCDDRTIQKCVKHHM